MGGRRPQALGVGAQGAQTAIGPGPETRSRATLARDVGGGERHDVGEAADAEYRPPRSPAGAHPMRSLQ
jgi:hypothetical protein